MTTRNEYLEESEEMMNAEELPEDAYQNDYYKEFIIASLKILSKDWRAVTGFSILAIFIVVGLIGPRILAEPTTTGPRLVGPFETWSHPLGTDGTGRDILATTIFAIPPMMIMIVSGAVFGTVLATGVGVFSAYKGGKIDRFLVNVMDTVVAVPGFPLIIVVAAIFEPTHAVLIGIIMTINAWAGLAKMIRSEAMSIMEDSYIEASICHGLSTTNIIGEDILPNLAPYITIHFVGMARRVIFHSVGLYFLGVLPYTAYNWGRMMNSAYQMGALSSPRIAHWLIVPIVTIILLTVSFTLIAQSMDNIFNPRLRTRHMGSAQPESKPESESEHQTKEVV